MYNKIPVIVAFFSMTTYV